MVQSSPHIGNFRSFLMADLPSLHLRMRGYKVTQVLNITDVEHLTEDDIEEGEDKMIASGKFDAPGRWIVQTTHELASWEVIVEPDLEDTLLVVITAYPVDQS